METSLFLFIYRLSDLGVFFLLLSFLGGFSFLGMALVHRSKLELTSEETNILCTFSTIIGTIYAVLAGFCVLCALNYFQAATDVVERESDTVIQIDHTINLLGSAEQIKALNSLMQQYTRNLIQLEWPAMSIMKRDSANDGILNQITKVTLDSRNPTEIQKKIFDLTLQLSNVREQRYDMVFNNRMSDTEWYTMFVITLLTLMTIIIVKMHLWIHALVLFILAMTCTLMLTVIITLDAPFYGIPSIFPTQLENKLAGITDRH